MLPFGGLIASYSAVRLKLLDPQLRGLLPRVAHGLPKIYDWRALGVQHVYRCPECRRRDMRVSHRRCDGGVSKKFFDEGQRDTPEG